MVEQTANAPKQFIISEVTLNKVLNTLSERPFKEVAGLINELQQTVRPLPVSVPGKVPPVKDPIKKPILKPIPKGKEKEPAPKDKE